MIPAAADFSQSLFFREIGVADLVLDHDAGDFSRRFGLPPLPADSAESPHDGHDEIGQNGEKNKTEEPDNHMTKLDDLPDPVNAAGRLE